MTVNELRDLINLRVKDNTGGVISPTKTTGMMLKEVLLAAADLLENTQELDKRYHIKTKGDIKLFYGNIFDLPNHYILCDGSNGTPDMRGKIPLMWSMGYTSSPVETSLSGYHHIGAMAGKRNTQLSNQSANGTAPAGTANWTVDNQNAPVPVVDNRQPCVTLMFLMYVGPSAQLEVADKTVWAEYDAAGGLLNPGTSTTHYGFRRIEPSMFSSPILAMSGDSISQAPNENDVISNIGFIPADNELCPVERWLHTASKGDNLNT